MTNSKTLPFVAFISLLAGNVAGQEGTLDEIIVTVEKREASLQDVAAAVTAVSGEQIVDRGVATLRDAQMVIPAARFNNEANNTQVFVRGVGSNLDFGNVEPTVGFNFNGVYMPREATSTGFFDIASVEVLPGPQGTLYGRGSMGGTIDVKFNRPGFDNAGNVLLEAGNENLINATVTQDFAFSEQLAIRLAINHRSNDGYFTSGADEADILAGRFSVLFVPNDAFSAYLWAFSAENDGSTPNLVNHNADGSFLTSDPYDDVSAAAITQTFLPFPIDLPTADGINYEVQVAGGDLKWNVGDLTLTYIPGFTELDSEPRYWLGILPASNTAHIEMQSHELRLAGSSDSLDWLAGVFYYDQENWGVFDIFLDVFVFPGFQQRGVDIRNNSIEGSGAFGQATWNLSDRLRLTLGGRYSEDSRDANGGDPDFLVSGQCTFCRSWKFSNDYSNFDWKAAIEFDLEADVMLYGSVQTAYQPGTYNSISQEGIDAGDPNINPGTPYDGTIEVGEPELQAFAIGLKSRIADNSLQINVEAFYYIYEDHIIQQFNSAALYNPVFNAEEVEIKGAQADLLWLPTANDWLNLSVGYTRARNERFVTPNGQDFTGLQPPYSPDRTFIGSYTRTFDVARGTLDANIAARYESSWFATFTHAPGTRQEATTKVDASLTFNGGENWSVALWGKNLTDEEVIAATAEAGVPGPGTAFLEAPRTYGVRLQINW